MLCYQQSKLPKGQGGGTFVPLRTLTPSTVHGTERGLSKVPSIREHRAAPERKSQLQNQAQRDLENSSANG